MYKKYFFCSNLLLNSNKKFIEGSANFRTMSRIPISKCFIKLPKELYIKYNNITITKILNSKLNYFKFIFLRNKFMYWSVILNKYNTIQSLKLVSKIFPKKHKGILLQNVKNSFNNFLHGLRMLSSKDIKLPVGTKNVNNFLINSSFFSLISNNFYWSYKTYVWFIRWFSNRKLIKYFFLYICTAFLVRIYDFFDFLVFYYYYFLITNTKFIYINTYLLNYRSIFKIVKFPLRSQNGRIVQRVYNGLYRVSFDREIYRKVPKKVKISASFINPEKVQTLIRRTVILNSIRITNDGIICTENMGMDWRSLVFISFCRKYDVIICNSILNYIYSLSIRILSQVNKIFLTYLELKYIKKESKVYNSFYIKEFNAFKLLSNLASNFNEIPEEEDFRFKYRKGTGKLTGPYKRVSYQDFYGVKSTVCKKYRALFFNYRRI